MTFIGAQSAGFTRLSGDLPSGLLMTEQFEKAHSLVCTASGEFAVCLEASSGFRAFELDDVNDSWRGCFVTGIQLQADLSSAFTAAQQDIRPGDLVIDDGGIFVASKPDRLGNLPRMIRWADAATLGSGNVRGGFSRWRVVYEENDSVCILSEVNSEA